MGQSSILSIIHTVTIGALLNFSSGNNGHGMKSVTCKQTLVMKWKKWGRSVDLLLRIHSHKTL